MHAPTRPGVPVPTLTQSGMCRAVGGGADRRAPRRPGPHNTACRSAGLFVTTCNFSWKGWPRGHWPSASAADTCGRRTGETPALHPKPLSPPCPTAEGQAGETEDKSPPTPGCVGALLRLPVGRLPSPFPAEASALRSQPGARPPVTAVGPASVRSLCLAHHGPLPGPGQARVTAIQQAETRAEGQSGATQRSGCGQARGRLGLWAVWEPL